ncbi:MAG: zinc ribbon domain-containing protein [Caldilineaceae bacterium]|nr:zinc ribbon domain-containing protein [Caldilineaceae bacterium]
METVQRICENCGAAGPLAARYCPSCGYDREVAQPKRELPIRSKNLPMVLGKAALPLLAGAASLALRAGWKLLQARLAATTPEQAAAALQRLANATPTQVSVDPQSTSPARKARRTVHIKSSWAVGDSNGNWQRGSSEHTIEFEE